MALDHGTRRIGIALCDPAEAVATPFAVWKNEGHPTVRRLAGLAADEAVEGIVVGLPRHDDGRESATAPAARQLAAALKNTTVERPVVLWGEQLTTVEADRRMSEAGMPAKRRALHRDAYAAAALLEDFLAARRARHVPADVSGSVGERV